MFGDASPTTVTPSKASSAPSTSAAHDEPTVDTLRGEPLGQPRVGRGIDQEPATLIEQRPVEPRDRRGIRDDDGIGACLGRQPGDAVERSGRGVVTAVGAPAPRRPRAPPGRTPAPTAASPTAAPEPDRSAWRRPPRTIGAAMGRPTAKYRPPHSATPPSAYWVASTPSQLRARPAASRRARRPNGHSLAAIATSEKPRMGNATRSAGIGPAASTSVRRPAARRRPPRPRRPRLVGSAAAPPRPARRGRPPQHDDD